MDLMLMQSNCLNKYGNRGEKNQIIGPPECPKGLSTSAINVHAWL